MGVFMYMSGIQLNRCTFFLQFLNMDCQSRVAALLHVGSTFAAFPCLKFRYIPCDEAKGCYVVKYCVVGSLK